MIGATPNQQHVDAFARELRSRYAPARLAERTTEELRDARRLVDVEVDRFAESFPEEEPTGPPAVEAGTGAGPDGRAERRPLSAFERERLGRLRSETKLAIDRELDSRTDGQDGPGRRFSRSRAALGVASEALSDVVHLSPRRR
jgi:hypothetical protein